MGLDMYLDKSKYVSNLRSNEDKILYKVLPKLFDIDLSENVHGITVTFPCMYWRKVNSIHNWFVQNVQEGNDDCKEYNVDIDQLKKLLDDCKKQLENPECDILSPTDGFFFGSTEKDDWYWDNIKNTIQELEKEIKWFEKNPEWDYSYSASW